jgi:multidrug efflux pump subunit AcrA (membrane-fusion protein)
MTAAAAAAALGAVAGLGGCSGGGPSGIVTAAVGYATVAQVVQASANILPKAQVALSAPSSGTLAALDVHDGQQVAAGQVLGTISSPAARQQLAQAKKALAQAPSAGDSGVDDTSAGFSAAAASDQSSADAAFRQAKQEAEKVQDAALRAALLAEIKAAQSSFNAAMSSVDAAVSAFQQGLGSASQVLDALGQTTRTQDQAAVDAAQSAVNALTIVAPISGTVSLGDGQASSGSGVSASEISALLAAAESGGSSAVTGSSGSGGSLGALGGSGSGSAAGNGTMIAAGAPIDSGGTLFTVTDASALSVSAQVDETDVLTVHPGVTASIQLNAVPGASYQGTVTSVDPTSTTSSQGSVTYTVRLSLGRGRLGDGSAAPAPLPGMTAIADLNVLTARHALSVPSSALIINGQTTSVWVLTGGVAHLRRISLGAQGDATVQVVAGLSAGARVVVSGADKVSDGERLG